MHSRDKYRRHRDESDTAIEGIFIANSNNIVIENSLISGYDTSSSATGIVLVSSPDITISSCFIGTDILGSSPFIPNETGIYIFDSTGFIISGNIISGNVTKGVWVTD